MEAQRGQGTPQGHTARVLATPRLLAIPKMFSCPRLPHPESPVFPGWSPHICVERGSSAWGRCHHFLMILAVLRTTVTSRLPQNCDVFGLRSVSSGFSTKATVVFTPCHPGSWAPILRKIRRSLPNGAWSPGDEGPA